MNNQPRFPISVATVSLTSIALSLVSGAFSTSDDFWQERCGWNLLTLLAAHSVLKDMALLSTSLISSIRISCREGNIVVSQRPEAGSCDKTLLLAESFKWGPLLLILANQWKQAQRLGDPSPFLPRIAFGLAFFDIALPLFGFFGALSERGCVRASGIMLLSLVTQLLAMANTHGLLPPAVSMSAFAGLGALNFLQASSLTGASQRFSHAQVIVRGTLVAVAVPLLHLMVNKEYRQLLAGVAAFALLGAALDPVLRKMVDSTINAIRPRHQNELPGARFTQ